MTQESSFPRSNQPPNFVSIKINLRHKKVDGKVQQVEQPRIIDLLAMNVVGEVSYYETVFSPATSVSMTIVNPNIRTKVFEDYALLGGEQVEIYATDIHDAGQISSELYFTGIVTQVDNITSNNFAEVFRIRISSEWEFPNGSGITGNIEGTPSKIASSILKGAYERNNARIDFPNAAGGNNKLVDRKRQEDLKIYADPSNNNVTFNIGKEKKDNVMALLMRLAAMARIDRTSAGFFFYRNKEGYFFRSIDRMIESASEGYRSEDSDKGLNWPAPGVFKYTYNGYNPGQDNIAQSLFSVATLQLQTNDSVQMKQLGFDGNSEIITTDLLKYNFYTSSQSENPATQFDFKLAKNNVYETLDWGKGDTSNLYTRQINMGLTFTDKLFDDNNLPTLNRYYDPHKAMAIGKARYSSLLGVSVTMTVPLNFNLIAGTMVEVEILRTKPQQDCSIEESQDLSDYSGLYIIAGVCHALDRKKGYSSLHLVRDQGKFVSRQNKKLF
jgi:hypothetical protein